MKIEFSDKDYDCIAGGGTCICNYNEGNRIPSNEYISGRHAYESSTACYALCCQNRRLTSYAFWNNDGKLLDNYKC